MQVLKSSLTVVSAAVLTIAFKLFFDVSASVCSDSRSHHLIQIADFFGPKGEGNSSVANMPETEGGGSSS